MNKWKYSYALMTVFVILCGLFAYGKAKATPSEDLVNDCVILGQQTAATILVRDRGVERGEVLKRVPEELRVMVDTVYANPHFNILEYPSKVVGRCIQIGYKRLMEDAI